MQQITVRTVQLRVFKENTRMSVSVDIYISVRACICRENDNAPL